MNSQAKKTAVRCEFLILAWRPIHVSPTEDVKVKVGNGFTAVRTIIDDETVAGGGYVFAAGDFGSGKDEVA